ncbi:MAG TPA: antitoxin [Propionibacterium sp.]|nr:antitoxin [Propionibacterium sp.]
MGIFDDIKGKADANEANVEAVVDQAGDFINEKTGGQHADKVEQATDFLKDNIGAPNADAPQQPQV